MNLFEYPIHVSQAEPGGFSATCRDVPELHALAGDEGEALAKASAALDEVFAGLMRQGQELPAPSPAKRGEQMVSPRVETVAKAALYVAMREAGITKVQLAQRMGVDEKEVRRLLDPHHGSKLPAIARAVSLLGKRLVIGLEAA